MTAWRDWRRLSLPLPLGQSPRRIPALALAERAGHKRAGRLKDHDAQSLRAALEPALRRDAALCADGDSALAAFARARGLNHDAFPAKHGPRVAASAFHVQAVGDLHAALKDFLRPFQEPATRCLDGYPTRFITRRRRQDPRLAIIAARAAPNAEIAEKAEGY